MPLSSNSSQSLFIVFRGHSIGHWWWRSSTFSTLCGDLGPDLSWDQTQAIGLWTGCHGKTRVSQGEAESTKLPLAIAESQTDEAEDGDDWKDLQEDNDDNKELYELTGKKVSRRDMHNILNYAIRI